MRAWSGRAGAAITACLLAGRTAHDELSTCGDTSWKYPHLVVQEELPDPKLAAAYLTAALEGSQEEFLLALRSVAHAHGGLGAVAEATLLNRQTLCGTLSGQGDPTLATLQGVLRAVGLTLAMATGNRQGKYREGIRPPD